MKHALLAGGTERTERPLPPAHPRVGAFISGDPSQAEPTPHQCSQRCPLTALDLRHQQGPKARSQKRKPPNAFSSYQLLSLWTQAVYFLVLRGRRVGHPAGCKSTSPHHQEGRSGNRERRLSAQLHPRRSGPSPRRDPRRHRTRLSRGGGALPASRLGRGRMGVTQVANAGVGGRPPGLREERPSPRAPPPTVPPPSALQPARPVLCARPSPASQLRGYQSPWLPLEGGVRGIKKDPSRPRPQARGGQVERLWEKKAGGERNRAGQGSAWSRWGRGLRGGGASCLRTPDSSPGSPRPRLPRATLRYVLQTQAKVSS